MFARLAALLSLSAAGLSTSVAALKTSMLARLETQTGAGFTIIEKEAANAGLGLPGCDKDTFIRYNLLFCAGDKNVKALKDDYFNRLTHDVKSFKTGPNKELGFKKWRMDAISRNGFSVCHNALGEFAADGDACAYEFKEEGPDGTTVKASTSSAELFGTN